MRFSPSRKARFLDVIRGSIAILGPGVDEGSGMGSFLRRCAIRAKPFDFERCPADDKAAAGGDIGKGFDNRLIIKLRNPLAAGADQELGAVIIRRAIAGEEGVQSLDLVDKTLLDQKIERAVNHRWL